MSYVVRINSSPIIAIHEATCPAYVDRDPGKDSGDGVLWYGPYDTGEGANDKANHESRAHHKAGRHSVNLEFSSGCPLCRAQRAGQQ